jgi:hypothetical protein
LFSFFAQHNQNPASSICRGNESANDVTGWLTDPGCFLFVERSNCDKFRTLEACVSDVQRVLLATFSNALTGPLGSLARRFLTSTHLAPSFVKPGRDSHSAI